MGDGVYISFDGYHVKLQANIPATDTIYLDFSVRRALYELLKLEFDKDDE